MVVSFVYIRDKIYRDFDQNVPDKTLFLEFVPVNMVHSSRNLMRSGYAIGHWNAMISRRSELLESLLNKCQVAGKF